MNDVSKRDRKRPFPWVIVTLVALAGLLAWRMASVPSSVSVEHVAIGPELQIGMTVAPAQEGYACSTPELISQATAFQVIDAKDKLRSLLDRSECVRVTQQQRFKITALKEKLAQVIELGASPGAALWMPARELTFLTRM